MVKIGTVNIMTNRPNGTLHLGVTSNLGLRAWQHRTGALAGFTKRYGLTRLVWYEHHEDHCGDPAGAYHEALVAGLEGAADPGFQPELDGLYEELNR